MLKNHLLKEIHMINDKEFVKQSRDKSQEFMRWDNKVASTKWLDKKPILMCSTAFGVNPEDTYKRWCKKENKYVDVSRLAVIKNYNDRMGVHLADRMLALYAQRSRTNRWTLRTILHISDLASVNRWLQYRVDKTTMGLPKNKKIFGLP